ncbi:Potassium/sodium hyperpolarization-activated cyclic nucleotide-gated channel protein [Cocos nucifera]|nr:Potassium/sodium hyperpolarization-activated cyclic nucleotide-gated channel protein [Cocos nucifera]
MASALRFLPLPNPRPFHSLPSRQKSLATVAIPRCSSNSNSNGNPNPTPEENNSIPEPPPAAATTSFEVEKRVKSAILRDGRRAAKVERPEPPNFEIGWKRTKEIETEKPKGWMIADFLDKLEGLMGRQQYGSAEMLAKVGVLVAERAREEAEVLVAGGEVEERLVTELYRVLKLMEMDLEMVKAAFKEETLAQRLGQAQARCRQAILVALSF